MLAINDLAARLRHHRDGLREATQRVVDSGWLVLGPEVLAFEREFAEFVGVDFCLGVANGTDAIELALRALGVKSGMKVATAANAGGYTTLSVMHLGAASYYMDVDLDTQCVGVEQVRAALDAGVGAVVVTHLYGRSAPQILHIAQLCEQRGVPLLEDCAQAHGARMDGRHVGSFGSAATFSFYPTKNLGALGDGGAVVCNGTALAQAVRELRQYGWKEKYFVGLEGGRNSRLDELQSAYLRVFLPSLDAENARRRAVAVRYCSEIKHPDVVVPAGLGDTSHVAHLYTVLCGERNALRQHLKDCGIAADIHYPVPDHLQGAWQRSPNVSLPNTELLSRQLLTLPCHPDLSEADQTRVISSVNAWRR
jgi:dTDP-3-amino-2,3,6-trideoxy-4-keto-D-glucose/dTDP-3-amino-3,4,6-trideoxy-alpha-D-glucose/dTDP-2,6-dideoxy-D-kanosamine transaminase